MELHAAVVEIIGVITSKMGLQPHWKRGTIVSCDICVVFQRDEPCTNYKKKKKKKKKKIIHIYCFIFDLDTCMKLRYIHIKSIYYHKFETKL